MLKRPFGIVSLAFLIIAAPGFTAGQAPQAPVAPPAGNTLLDAFISTFLELSKSGTKATLEQNLPKMMAEAKKARQEKQVDPVFFARFTRMLAIFKLVTTADPEGVIAPLVDREIGSFVKDTIGENLEAKGGPQIRQLAEAVKEEILDLRIRLDSRANKEKMRAEFDRKFQEALPDKK